MKQEDDGFTIAELNRLLVDLEVLKNEFPEAQVGRKLMVTSSKGAGAVSLINLENVLQDRKPSVAAARGRTRAAVLLGDPAGVVTLQECSCTPGKFLQPSASFGLSV